MNVHNARLLTDAVIAALQAAGLTVYDADVPESGAWHGQASFAGYVVVYGLTGGFTDGTIANPNDDAQALYQLTSVGADRQQCEWIADKARSTMMAATLAPAGRTVMFVTIDMLGGTQRDDDVQPPAFYSPDRYRIWTTP